jgi:hypothetical protein
MTYGNMPPWDVFFKAFQEEQDGRLYNITLSSTDSAALQNFKLGDGAWSANDLYEACKEITEYSPQTESFYAVHDKALDLVSGILYTLKIEWV